VREARIARLEAAKEAAMRVERIYTRSIVGVRKSSTIQEAAALMRKHHVGTLLVMGDEPEVNTLLGFITDRDIVLQAVADGLSPQVVTAGKVMTPNVTTVREDDDVHDALETMRTAGIRRLIVMGADGTVLDWRLGRNPRIVRAESPGPDGVLSGSTIQLPSAELLVTVADVPGARHVDRQWQRYSRSRPGSSGRKDSMLLPVHAARAGSATTASAIAAATFMP
jgi:CBS domain-containing protein